VITCVKTGRQKVVTMTNLEIDDRGGRFINIKVERSIIVDIPEFESDAA
jgi:hypothetical protein